MNLKSAEQFVTETFPHASGIARERLIGYSLQIQADALRFSARLADGDDMTQGQIARLIEHHANLLYPLRKGGDET